eukprot:m.186455 g.186455  ORF g.186455 m.186455 type:complete len:541 (-) comp32269_c0_seq1:667-2289(-)
MSNILKNPLRNKGLGFTPAERETYGLVGLLPPAVNTLELQATRSMVILDSYEKSIHKYSFLMGLQDRNERLFYKLLIDNVEKLMPLVYTPVVGTACTDFASIYQFPRGFYISLNDAGNVRKLLNNAPDGIQCIVVTDGERILGLGDLGCSGMGIPIGKMALYVALAGINPAVCLPITIDVGTNNETMLADPLYLGLRQKRCRTQAYDDLIDEFVHGCKDRWGAEKLLLQWEDFGNSNAFKILAKYQKTLCSFNDDIQGTASVAVAGIISASSSTGKPLSEQTFVFLGAGEAGVGIANLLAYAISRTSNLTLEEARKKIFMVDSRGLITAERTGLAEHKLAYAHTGCPACPDLISTVKACKPTGIIGVSTVPKAFTEEILQAVSENTTTPIVFAMTNPTWKAECTAEEAYRFTDGKCIFASGSPFDPVTMPDGRVFHPGQGNNAYIFPGVGLGALVCGAKSLDQESFYIAATTLAAQTTEDDWKLGRMFPPLQNIREVSTHVAAAVAAHAYDTNVATVFPRPPDLVAACKAAQWEPTLSAL